MVAIIGDGLIGRSIALALARQAAPPDVISLDKNDPLTRAAGADVIVLAAPITANIQLLQQLPSVLTGEVLITDTGSTKRSTADAAATLPAHLHFIGGHPMAGAPASGSSAARADLFDGRLWILTPPQGCSPSLVDRLRALIESLGATVVEMTPEDHDRIMASVSHLPQLAISALMAAVGEAVGDEGLRFAGPGLRDSTRIAASSGAVWADILDSNGDFIDAALDRLIARLQALRQRHDELPAAFEKAAMWKSALDASEPR